jgi:hypothetical protein
MSKELFLQQNLKTDEIYAGLILGKDGQPDYHLALLPAKSDKDLNWNDAMAWAKTTGGDLPTRREQSLLFANSKEHFESRWYWSNAQHADYSDYAWLQDFGTGVQDDGHESGEARARAVRRFSII